MVIPKTHTRPRHHTRQSKHIAFDIIEETNRNENELQSLSIASTDQLHQLCYAFPAAPTNTGIGRLCRPLERGVYAEIANGATAPDASANYATAAAAAAHVNGPTDAAERCAATVHRGANASPQPNDAEAGVGNQPN